MSGDLLYKKGTNYIPQMEKKRMIKDRATVVALKVKEKDVIVAEKKSYLKCRLLEK